MTRLYIDDAPSHPLNQEEKDALAVAVKPFGDMTIGLDFATLEYQMTAYMCGIAKNKGVSIVHFIRELNVGTPGNRNFEGLHKAIQEEIARLHGKKASDFIVDDFAFVDLEAHVALHYAWPSKMQGDPDLSTGHGHLNVPKGKHLPFFHGKRRF